jgi:hypothetical protein
MIELGAFLDTYYAYDFNRPVINRQFTTQQVKHHRPSINLAHIDVNIKESIYRSRIAFQAGDSVERNAILEPGPEKYIQEAYLGRSIGQKTWVDAGIFLGNIGAESWISRDNWTYSRALNLDYVPYYSAGVRIEHEIDEKQSTQFQVLNGWQNISETNRSKAIGMQYKNILSERITFTYNNFFGDEEVVSSNPRFRAYHNFILKWHFSDEWQYLSTFDIGHQSQQHNSGIDPWYSATFTSHKIINPVQSFAIRAEYYNDRHQANILTKTPRGFQALGISFNFDQVMTAKMLWRNELRGFYSIDKIYPQSSGTKQRPESYIATSIAISM